MVKKLSCLIIFMFILSGCFLFTPENEGEGANEKKVKWTLLIHFAIDNNIDYLFENSNGIVSIYLQTLEELKGVPYNDNLNIVILMDAYDKDISNIGYTSKFKDGYYYLKGVAFSNDLVVAKDEINSGDVKDVKDFIDWAIKNYPAEHYIYSVFSHGTGFDDKNTNGTYSIIKKGVAFDDSQGDTLTHYELGEITKYLKEKIGKKIDIFYPYACLMGGVELAYELKDNVDYILFSEELFPVTPLSYDPFGLAINKNSSISALDLCKYYCDYTYEIFYEYDIPFTLSVVDTSKVDELKNKIDDFATAAVENISNVFIAKDYNEIASYSFSMYYYANIKDFYYIDLGDFLKKLTNSQSDLISSNVKEKAALLLSALNDTVVYQRNYKYDNATGLSIFHNVYGSTNHYELTLYTNILKFGRESKWAEYLSRFQEEITNKDPYEPDDDFENAKEIIVGAPPQIHSFHSDTDVDYLKVYLEAGKTYKIETYPFKTSCDTILYLYDNSYNQVAWDDDSGINLFSLIMYTPSVSGIYYIKIQRFSSGTDDYKIDVVEQ